MRVNSSQVREVAVGEVLTVGSTGTISCDSEHATVDGNRVTFSEPGRCRVTWIGGVFDALAFEPESLDAVPAKQSSGNIGGPDRSAAARRLVLRQLATHSNWDGRLSSIGSFNLSHFGA